MSFDWIDFLKLAKELAETSKTDSLAEARLRSSISRAYYAVFHAAYSHLDAKGQLPPDKGSMHNFIKRWFMQEERNKDERRIGAKYARLLERRIQADYNADFSNLSKRAFEVISDSGSAIQEIRRLSPL